MIKKKNRVSGNFRGSGVGANVGRFCCKLDRVLPCWARRPGPPPPLFGVHGSTIWARRPCREQPRRAVGAPSRVRPMCDARLGRQLAFVDLHPTTVEFVHTCIQMRCGCSLNSPRDGTLLNAGDCPLPFCTPSLQSAAYVDYRFPPYIPPPETRTVPRTSHTDRYT